MYWNLLDFVISWLAIVDCWILTPLAGMQCIPNPGWLGATTLDVYSLYARRSVKRIQDAALEVCAEFRHASC